MSLSHLLQVTVATITQFIWRYTENCWREKNVKNQHLQRNQQQSKGNANHAKCSQAKTIAGNKKAKSKAVDAWSFFNPYTLNSNVLRVVKTSGPLNCTERKWICQNKSCSLETMVTFITRFAHRAEIFVVCLHFLKTSLSFAQLKCKLFKELIQSQPLPCTWLCCKNKLWVDGSVKKEKLKETTSLAFDVKCKIHFLFCSS